MENNKALRVFAEEIRVETLKELAHLGFGHVGGAMSVVELLAVLYGKEMRIDPKQPQWAERDKLVMSKGHAGPAVYATLALKGYFPKEQLLTQLRATHDAAGSIEHYYATAALSGLNMTPADYMAAVEAVTDGDVQAAARSLQLHSTYFLKGDV